MKNVMVLVGLLSLIGCTPVKNNAVTCKQLADGYLNTQFGHYHYLVNEPQKKGNTIRLFYRVEQSYKLTQTQPKVFECVETSEALQLNLLENDAAKTVVILPIQKSLHQAG